MFISKYVTTLCGPTYSKVCVFAQSKANLDNNTHKPRSCNIPKQKSFDLADILDIEESDIKMDLSGGRIESDGEHVTPPNCAVGLSPRYN